MSARETQSRPDNTARFAQLRGLDLAAVLQALGAERDRYDKAKWRLDGQVISVTGSLFYDHVNERGGAGAIDLVMQVRGVDFVEAITYLDRPGMLTRATEPAPGAAQRNGTGGRESGLFVPPRAAPEHWTHVRTYLLEERGLPAALVDELHERGLVYADARQNAVFLRRDEGSQATGAFLRGTHPEHPFKGLAAGTERERGWFHFTVGDRGVPQMVLTESAIDALSYYALVHGNTPLAGSGAYREVYASTDGAGALPHALIARVLDDGGLVRAAFDRDERGERFWATLQERHPEAVPGVHLWRETPGAGKDWNDVLLIRSVEREQGSRGR
jgi:hypothetical protein